MEQWKESQPTRLSLTTELKSAYQISVQLIKNMGFKYCSFSTSYIINMEAPQLADFNNYPNAWNFSCKKQALTSSDPVVAQCNHSMMPVVWNEELFSRSPWV